MNFGERKIQVVSLPDVDSIDSAKIQNTLEKSYDKLQKIVNNEILLVCHFKGVEETGARKKREVHLRLSFGGLLVASHSAGWNVITSVQDAIKSLERETLKAIKKS